MPRFTGIARQLLPKGLDKKLSSLHQVEIKIIKNCLETFFPLIPLPCAHAKICICLQGVMPGYARIARQLLPKVLLKAINVSMPCRSQ